MLKVNDYFSRSRKYSFKIFRQKKSYYQNLAVILLNNRARTLPYYRCNNKFLFSFVMNQDNFQFVIPLYNLQLVPISSKYFVIQMLYQTATDACLLVKNRSLYLVLFYKFQLTLLVKKCSTHQNRKRASIATLQQYLFFVPQLPKRPDINDKSVAPVGMENKHTETVWLEEVSRVNVAQTAINHKTLPHQPVVTVVFVSIFAQVPNTALAATSRVVSGNGNDEQPLQGCLTRRMPYSTSDNQKLIFSLWLMVRCSEFILTVVTNIFYITKCLFRRNCCILTLKYYIERWHCSYVLICLF